MSSKGYRQQHIFEPSGEKWEGKELCKCGLPKDIPTMHLKEEPCMADCHWGHKHCEHCEELTISMKNISQLRQWINEDRITDKKLITNEDIIFWLVDRLKTGT